MTVFGTRPEAVKMCPLVLALRREAGIECLVCVSGQHREMAKQAMKIFEIEADYDLDIMQPGQTLTDITAKTLYGMETVLRSVRPDLVLVHGDTTTAFSTALAAFYAGVAVGHVEAGLRTESIASPFPEELNRRLVGRIARLHFSPTQRAADNLTREGIRQGVYVTGNTVIDALRYTVRPSYIFHAEALRNLPIEERLVLVTAHRRENWGQPMENICQAVLTLADQYPDTRFVFPVHPNPALRQAINQALADRPRIMLVEPLDIMDMHNLMAKAYLVLTDSGGIQEEAPALGAPVVVLRRETERPEAVENGTAMLAGIERDEIIRIAGGLLSDATAHDTMQKTVSPYGDGHACEKIVAHILKHFKEKQ